jgi:hypothetical protein
MARLLELRNRLKQMDTDKIAADSITNTKEALLNANTEQLHHGLGKDGDTLRPYRSPFYAEMKHRMNPLPGIGNPDLRLTGDFYRGFYLEVQGDKIEIDSRDEKSSMLKKKYGEEVIFGLSEKWRNEYIKESLNKEFMNQMHKATGL